MLMLILGIIVLLAGFSLHYWISRRRFYRRNIAGLEEFSSYERSWIVPFLERIGKLISLILIISGAFTIYVHFDLKNSEKSGKAKISKEKSHNISKQQ